MINPKLFQKILEKEFCFKSEDNTADQRVRAYFYGKDLNITLFPKVGIIEERLKVATHITILTLTCINTGSGWTSQLGDGKELEIYNKVVSIIRNKKLEEILD